MNTAILDTSVYIAHWEGTLPAARVADIRRQFVIRQSAVVLSELRRGARTPPANRLVDELRKFARSVLAPTSHDWWEAGRLVRVVGDREGWEVNKRREFQNDALIALTARRFGATLVTGNHGDFKLLAQAVRFKLFCL